MNLTENPEITFWPRTHFIFVERVGPFLTTAPQAWEELRKNVPLIEEYHKITSYMSLYKFKPQLTYRAGVVVTAAPSQLPQGLHYEKFAGGKYARFTLTGPYSDLPQASRRVFDIVKEKEIQIRDAFCVENYVNNPQTTAAEKLITEILIPI